ncbi:MAG: amidohydrolase family protein [Spirochaetales bacterium]|nr:amidohydrolase family protein [Spirochaetales bacterium]
MEDERFQNPQMQIPAVPVEDIIELAEASPELSIICLNMNRNETISAKEYGNISFDIAFVDWFKPIDDLMEHVPPERVLFGSNSPLFVTRAAVMKVTYADVEDSVKNSIFTLNAERLINIK